MFPNQFLVMKSIIKYHINNWKSHKPLIFYSMTP